ncbi:hypothetical protein [Cryptosporangium aurantiacum]|uniref:Uncharacterized protein n=1 Tax=Cryptosporangium aurantiacum TaxID=134849 RepID=A0A1M7QA48_9ACTN|nr:hypothetical protein [Cryptosporangium aurantiacum]SHN27561.1 hypothetical protein SAMN05443668_104383 [Cryptosporangium aurantiacum]
MDRARRKELIATVAYVGLVAVCATVGAYGDSGGAVVLAYLLTLPGSLVVVLPLFVVATGIDAIAPWWVASAVGVAGYRPGDAQLLRGRVGPPVARAPRGRVIARPQKTARHTGPESRTLVRIRSTPPGIGTVPSEGPLFISRGPVRPEPAGSRLELTKNAQKRRTAGFPGRRCAFGNLS